MKKAIFIIGSFILINSINCFSQTISKYKKVTKSETKYVYGYLNNYSEAYNLGICFEKVINLSDTSYFMILYLSSPDSKYNTDICINTEYSIKFKSKSGRFVDIQMIHMNTSVESEILNKNDFPMDVDVVHQQTVLKLAVTKDELIKISSEPFYRILLPYFNCSTKEYNYIEFVKPALFTKRVFIQEIINSILN